jgi:hypothetical protein
MQYSGIKLTASVGSIDKLQPLKLSQCLKGEYDISYRFLSTDLNDSLNLVVGSGSISVSLNNGSTWTKIDRSYSFNYNKNFSKFKLKIDSKSANFALVANDRLTPSTPKIQLNLGSSFDFDLPDTKYYSWSMGGIDPLTGLSWNNGRVTRSDSTIGIKITETIGGDDVSDYAKFSLNEASKIKLQTNNKGYAEAITTEQELLRAEYYPN